ncbi:MAG: hypothetical protein HFI90_05630 [Clostridia bacterium]|nr:hypothetical protein [Clostridia bacterium]
MKKQLLSLVLALSMLMTIASASLTVLAANEITSEKIDVTQTGDFPTISVSDYGVFAIKRDENLWFYGPEKITERWKKQTIKIMDGVKAVSAAGINVFMIQKDGSLWIGKHNIESDETKLWTPVKIMDNVKVIGANQNSVLAVKYDNSLWLWSANDYGVFGEGTEEKIMDDVKAVSAGTGYYMAIKNDGSLWTWGNNEYGQLGDGTTENRTAPVKIMDNVRTISAGRVHSFAIKNDGSLWAWGSNECGLLGDGTATVKFVEAGWFDVILSEVEEGYLTEANNDRTTPVKVMDDVKAVGAGYAYSLAVKNDGSLWTWGSIAIRPSNVNPKYKADVYKAYAPDKLMDYVVLIDPGVYDDAIAVKSDGTLWSWRGEQLMDDIMLSTEADDVSVPTEVSPGEQPDAPSSWAEADISNAITLGFVPQELQSKFVQATTRAEFCSLAVALYETKTGNTITKRTTFNDTKDENVEKAAAIGVVSGVGNNMFEPDGQLTREQAATMLSRLSEVIGCPLTNQTTDFADMGSISSWAAEAVGKVQAAGIMSGVGDNMFEPQGLYTREQSIITMLRLHNVISTTKQTNTTTEQTNVTTNKALSELVQDSEYVSFTMEMNGVSMGQLEVLKRDGTYFFKILHIAEPFGLTVETTAMGDLYDDTSIWQLTNGSHWITMQGEKNEVIIDNTRIPLETGIRTFQSEVVRHHRSFKDTGMPYELYLAMYPTGSKEGYEEEYDYIDRVTFQRISLQAVQAIAEACGATFTLDENAKIVRIEYNK